MSTPLHTEVLAANAAYVSTFGAKANLALPPARSAAFLICMDARINPAASLGLAEGDAHVIRNAGGRASEDAIRSFVISHKLLGTKEWFIIQHTDCGMLYFKSNELATLLETSLATADIVPSASAPMGVTFVNKTSEGGSKAGHAIHWLHIDDQIAAIKEDVNKVATHELVAAGIPIHGYVYNVKTGAIEHVVSQISRA